MGKSIDDPKKDKDFNETLKRMLETPPTPHKAKAGKESPPKKKKAAKRRKKKAG